MTHHDRCVCEQCRLGIEPPMPHAERKLAAFRDCIAALTRLGKLQPPRPIGNEAPCEHCGDRAETMYVVGFEPDEFRLCATCFHAGVQPEQSRRAAALRHAPAVKAAS